MLNKADEKEWEALRSVDFSTSASIATLPLAERWIVSQLHKVRADLICGLPLRVNPFPYS